MIIISLVAYICETIQNLRGINARFTNTDLPFSYLNDLNTTVAAMLILLFIVFTVIVFQTKKQKHPLFLFFVKYSCFAVILGEIAYDVWMSIEQERWIGDAGNSWIVLILLLFIQTVIGKSISEITIYLGFIILSLIICLICLLWSFRKSLISQNKM